MQLRSDNHSFKKQKWDCREVVKTEKVRLAELVPHLQLARRLFNSNIKLFWNLIFIAMMKNDFLKDERWKMLKDVDIVATVCCRLKQDEIGLSRPRQPTRRYPYFNNKISLLPVQNIVYTHIANKSGKFLKKVSRYLNSISKYKSLT
jgi:hypothetical protein